MCENEAKRLLSMKEASERIDSFNISGFDSDGHYIQVITNDITESDLDFFRKYDAKRVPYKEGHKTRFYFSPDKVEIVEDRDETSESD